MSNPQDCGGVPPMFRRARRRRIQATLDAFVPVETAIDERNIEATLKARDPEPSVRIERHHRNLVRSGAGSGGPKYRTLGEAIDQELKEGEAFVLALEKQVRPLPERVVVNGEGTPWTPLSWIKVITSGAMIVGAMAMGSLLITSSLVNAGLFETKLDASGWLIVPLTGPFALKTLASWMSPRARGLYVAFLGTATGLLLVTWCLLYPVTYGHSLSPEMPMPPEEGTESDSDSMVALLFVGLLSEACFAAVLFLGIEHVAESHQQDAPNHQRKRLERIARHARGSLDWLKDKARPRCAEINAWHEHEEARLLGSAVDFYDTLRNTVAVIEQRNETGGAHGVRRNGIGTNGTPTGGER